MARPKGKKVIGLGGRISPSFGYVNLDLIVPASDLRSVSVSSFTGPVPSPVPWRLEAYAVCVPPLPSQTWVWAIYAG